ncbi:hypothetical protein QBC38DRAFT_453496 [Podospora fimiseda]|uniref:Zn(2)-C6 fungal-type domain-containing protein n=1 Tax=Podospora fimiseda TaxID=252190 RepID=A0AAN7H4Z2_9PEZI|nr:hypothetical protein QBC38DRAFT_453496 [Podospora fimiseda]
MADRTDERIKQMLCFAPDVGTKTTMSARVGRRNVRTGCIKCTIRKIKCDGIEPSCNRCSKTGRTCHGYDDGGLSRRMAMANLTSASAGEEVSSTQPVMKDAGKGTSGKILEGQFEKLLKTLHHSLKLGEGTTTEPTTSLSKADILDRASEHISSISEENERFEEGIGEFQDKISCPNAGGE